ncbi:CDP-alcohol phosphatidyltransferase family protein [Pseudonocardia sp. ICBG1034]|uniref:CDP-alcohol phosphatidyltransferase family protein n=1 Tax=Pseudonocardia sp. ICBG1034 TaxID=2844381 RepID=UPI001CCD5287|nr:CDP-alcohol phosphatidyltransferase family protein [Pseudonocardia sp. ICBG1034]
MLRRTSGTAATAPVALQVAAGAVLLTAVLAVLVPTTGAGALRVTGAAVVGVVAAALLLRAARRAGERTLGPAGVVTLARGALAVAVVALVGLDGAGTVALVALTALALALDGVDGPVARRTGTVTALGARFDMETDAFLLMVLSVHVAATTGHWWVTALGLLRYAFVAAGRAAPWLRGELPPRYSAKVVAALQGIVLVVTAAGVLPDAVALTAVGVALAALAWSFGVSVVQLWRAADRHPFHARRAGAALLTTLCLALVGGILVLPADPAALGPAGLLRLPIEAVLGAAVLALLPGRARRVAAALAGTLLGVVGLLKLADIGFLAFQGRRFDAVSDWSLLGNAHEFLRGAAGAAAGTAVAVLAAVVAVGLVVATAAAAARLGRLAARHRRATVGTAALLAAAWLLVGTLADARIVPGVPVAAADGVAEVAHRAQQVPRTLAERRELTESLARDAWAGRPPESLLTALDGTDVVIVFVESYGRNAQHAPEMAPRIRPVLAGADARLAAAGYGARSGVLTAPINGGGSWLAHATLFSGLSIADQGAHDRLTASNRLTLPRAFRDAGWETAVVTPATTREWPEAAFFGHQRVHAGADLGYAGPPFSWSPMPDQYTLDAFSRLELDRPGRGPLLGTVVLTSSHAPWSPVPPLLDPAGIGDGAVYGPYADGQQAYDTIFSLDRATLRADYLTSLEYALRSATGWVADRPEGDRDLVVLMLGDHEPGATVSGPGAGSDVPVSVITRDTEVLDRIDDWGWTPGLLPPPDAPPWPMAGLRDRFLAAFS